MLILTSYHIILAMSEVHSFHIPVMGIAFTIDTPIKVAHFGISSVVSICDDLLCEDMRKHYSSLYKFPFIPINEDETDARAKRITAYLNLLDIISSQNFLKLKTGKLEDNKDAVKYFSLLEENSPLKQQYYTYKASESEFEKHRLERKIKAQLQPGSIDVNIMTKVDKRNYAKDGSMLPQEYSDALAALRGFAQSTLHSSVIFSAGFNPKLYAYIEQFADFYPDENGQFKKKVILKVSDFRSAMVQGKFLAKKGIWVSEFRIESGLNCGGHAFATDGFLLGPILEEFKNKRDNLQEELFALCSQVWKAKAMVVPTQIPATRVSVQGGIGTNDEKNFLQQQYNVDSTGWGSPFLLVPEATTLDDITVQKLVLARKEDLYLSYASPLGVPFNNLRESDSEKVIKQRLDARRPGSPCLKKYLVSNTEFSSEPVCTASRTYQYHKHKQLGKDANKNDLAKLEAKACLCEDLAAPAYINNNIKSRLKPATAICPGPNIAFFSGVFSLKQMVDHIYGRANLLNTTYRPHVFINELELYINYLRNEIQQQSAEISAKQAQYFSTFKENLKEGINYYKNLMPKIQAEKAAFQKMMKHDLEKMEMKLKELWIPEEALAV